MPIYEYRCDDCGRRVSILVRSVRRTHPENLQCPECGSANLTKLVAQVAVLHSEESRLESPSDTSLLSDLDEADPRSVGRWIRRMGTETGQELGPDLEEIANRLEAGESPDEIDSSLSELVPPPQSS